jgi:signal peptidase I
MSRSNRRLLIISGVVTFLVALWIIGRVTGMLNFYQVSSTACEPKYKVGDRIFTSNLKKFERGDFVAYEDISGEIYYSQLIAMEGDVIEIRKNIAYVNGELADDTMQLKFAYIFEGAGISSDFISLSAAHPEKELSITPDGTILTNRTINEAKEFDFQKWFHAKGVADNLVWKGIENNWNRDWFGPFIIPKGCVFVMSPNRPNALDSRYRGPIEMKNIVGVNLD